MLLHTAWVHLQQVGHRKENEQKGIILPVPDVAHKVSKVKECTTPGPALSGIVLNPERIASTPRTKGDSLRLCLSQSTASHASSGI